MNLEELAVALLSELRRDTNGMVSGAMTGNGIDYGINYGVSAVVIRKTAGEYPKDQELARYLIESEVRELKIAAFSIAEPEKMTVEESDIWAPFIVNTELAENAAMSLWAHSPYLPAIFESWIDRDNPMLAYAATLAVARRIRKSGLDTDYARELIGSLGVLARYNAAYISRAMLALAQSISGSGDPNKTALETYLKQAFNDNAPIAGVAGEYFEMCKI